jgi:hypothetical protein
MHRLRRYLSRKALIVGGLILALAAGGAGVAVATSADDEQVTGPAADRARGAALEVTQGGKVGSVERDDDGAAWEVEVRKPDGSTAEVNLDGNYRSAGSATESDDREDSGASDDGEDNDASDDGEDSDASDDGEDRGRSDDGEDNDRSDDGEDRDASDDGEDSDASDDGEDREASDD